jgi:hypothetical protein
MDATVSEKYGPRFEAIRRMPDRELLEATFMLLSALAERLTGEAPVFATADNGMPNFICAADGPISWLPASRGERAVAERRPESARERPHTPTPIVGEAASALPQ